MAPFSGQDVMDNLIAWFCLKNVAGVGNHLFKRLIDTFGSPQQVQAAPHSQLCQVEGVTDKIARAIKQQEIPEAAYKNLALCQKHHIQVITLTDPDYPRLLKEIPDPPPYFYCCGQMIPDAACIAIVGSRSPTRYGLSLAEQLSRDLADRGLTIISGMARGIDTAAHQGALAVNGHTRAVLGSGLGRLYPPENRELAHRIRQRGAVVSEFPIFAPPESYHFPARNRIISGMSLGAIVVEAASKSGSLITARLAADQGREVFALPGSTRSAKSSGTHGLLKQGARLVENADDVLAEIAHMLPAHDNQKAALPPNRPPVSDQPLDKAEKQVIKQLEPYPVHIDTIAAGAGLDVGKTAAILLKLELKGLVEQEPGKRFLLTNEASLG